MLPPGFLAIKVLPVGAPWLLPQPRIEPRTQLYQCAGRRERRGVLLTDVMCHYPRTLLVPVEPETATGRGFFPPAASSARRLKIKISTLPANPSPPSSVPVPPAATSITPPTAEHAVAPRPAAAPDLEPIPDHAIRELGHEADMRRLGRTIRETRALHGGYAGPQPGDGEQERHHRFSQASTNQKGALVSMLITLQEIDETNLNQRLPRHPRTCPYRLPTITRRPPALPRP